MRQCFICKSESPLCGHREAGVILATYEAQEKAAERQWARIAEQLWSSGPWDLAQLGVKMQKQLLAQREKDHPRKPIARNGDAAKGL